MAFAAATPKQSELVQWVVLEIENNPEYMGRLTRHLAVALQKKIPGAAFRSLTRSMLSDFWPSCYPPIEELLFCMAWLWLNTLGQSTSDFFRSNSPTLQRRLDDLFSQCCTQEVVMPVQEENMPVSVSAPAFETRYYVYGRDIAKMSAEQLIAAIKQVECEIEELRAVKVESSFITKKIDELLDMRTEIVKRLDAR